MNWRYSARRSRNQRSADLQSAAAWAGNRALVPGPSAATHGAAGCKPALRTADFRLRGAPTRRVAEKGKRKRRFGATAVSPLRAGHAKGAGNDLIAG
jgi:hypothetical protein